MQRGTKMNPRFWLGSRVAITALVTTGLVALSSGSASARPTVEVADPTGSQLDVGPKEVIDRVSEELAIAADDLSPTAIGQESTAGTTLPQRASEGVTAKLPGGLEEVTVDLPARGQGVSLVPGSATYAGEHEDTNVTVDSVDASDIPNVAHSTRSQITIGSADAPKSYDFELDLPRGTRLVKQSDGSVFVTTSAGKVATVFAAPWAVDAKGRDVSTSFKISGNTLTQTVSHSNAAYPVVADPWWFVPVVIVGRQVAVKIAVKSATKSGAKKAAAKAAAARGRVRTVGTPIKGSFYTARGFKIRRYGTFSSKNGYSSFTAFKRANPGRKGYDWHHIVEHRNVNRFGTRMVNNKQNLILIPRGIHQKCVNSFMNTRLKSLSTAELRKLGIKRTKSIERHTLRWALGQYSLRNSHTTGLVLLSMCGVKIS